MQIVRVSLSTLVEGNIRSSFDVDALKRLAESLRKGQKTPILISGKRIVDGHRRVAAANQAGLTELDAIDCTGWTEEEIRDHQITHAFHSESLSDYDRAGALKSAKDGGLSNGETARKFDIDPGMVTKLLSLFDCPMEVQAAARRGEIGPSVWYVISKSPDPMATFALKQGGATRDEVAKSVKKKATTPAVRTAKIRCPLPSGQVVTVAGEELSLEEFIETLSEASKLAKAALAKSLNAKTAQRVWSDMAEAG